jgi:CysZ protein
MFTALALAFRQLIEPEMRRPFFISVIWSLGTLLLLWVLFHWSLSGSAWVPVTVAGLHLFAVPALSFTLFPSVVLLFLGFFSEAIILAVERRHYPALPPARGTHMLRGLASSVFLMTLGVLINLAAFIFIYWWAAWIPGANLIFFGLINGYLVGRGYFATVALRRFGGSGARFLWSRHRIEFILAGAAVAALSLVPVLNLVAPMVGLATTVHLIERVRRISAMPVSA